MLNSVRGKLVLLIISLLILVSCNNGQKVKKVETAFNIAVEQSFKAVAPDISNILFKNTINETQNFNYLLYPFIYFGGGVSIGDINNDGLPDIYLTGQMNKNKLYLNQGGMSFKDITVTAMVEGVYNHWTTGTTMADINNDGFLDIYVSVAGPGGIRKNLLYLNNKNNTFSEKAEEYGIADEGHSIQSAFFDYDNDGDLDLYVGNYPPSGFNQENNFFEQRLKQPNLKESDKLYRNDGGKFKDVTVESGILNYGLTLGLSFSDFNDDGFTDIYVSNDFNSSDFLYINQGNGSFLNEIQAYTNHTSNFGMGTDASDINNDGLPDLVQLDMMGSTNEDQKANMSAMNTELFYDLVDKGLHHQYMKNTLQLNTGVGNFIEIGELSGISYTDWSWCPLLFDMQNNGSKDLFVTNGMRRDVNNNDFNALFKIKKAYNEINSSQYVEWVKRMPSKPVTNFAFTNNGDLTFERKNKEFGLSDESFSNGAAYADLDLDGDLDLVVNHLDMTSQVFENIISTPSHSNFLRIQLKGTDDNSFGVGAKIKIYTENEQQLFELQTTRGYQSSVEPIFHFGLKHFNRVDSLQIVWPKKGIQTLYDIESNQVLVVNQTNNYHSYPDNSITSKQIFTNFEPELIPSYTHKENDFNDFQREVLLPHKMSQQGPAIAVADFNGDGLDDFYIGGAKNKSSRFYAQNDQGNFEAVNLGLSQSEKKYEDVSATFVDIDKDGDNDLFVCSGGNESPNGNSLYENRIYENDGKGNFKKVKNAFPKTFTSSSVVKTVDFDLDGDLDFFIGGRQVPGQYPLPTSSYILRNDSQSSKILLTDITKAYAPGLIDIGMITDAAWADINNDGNQDLIIVGEWSSPKIFINELEKLSDQTSTFGLDDKVGWWNSIKIVDINKDGHLDLLAGNLGLNYKYKASKKEPFKIFANDFDDNGKLDIVLGYYSQGELFPLRGRECSSQQIPSIKKKFPNYTTFSKANLEEVYAPKQLNEALKYEAVTFANSVFVYKSGQFVQKELPLLAQTSSINDMLIDDFDKDGNLDILAGGNLYGSEVETPRNDASYGLLLKGNGTGSFIPIQAKTSGMNISGEIKNIQKINISGIGESYIVARNNMSLIFLKRQ